MRVLSIFFWVTLLGSFGLSIANSEQPQQCSVTQNNNVLERAFGTVMVRKLASQTMKIEGKLDSMTTEMKNHVETQISGIKDQILEQMQAYFEEKCGQNVETTTTTTTTPATTTTTTTPATTTTTTTPATTATTLSRRQEVERELKAKLANFDGTEPEWVQDSLIWISNFGANFDDAQEQCQSYGGRLYEPKSLEHNKMVWNFLKSKGRDIYYHWIGINDIAREGVFVYATSGEPISFQHWGSWSTFGQQPDNFNGNHDCVQYVSSWSGLSPTGSISPVWQGPSDAWDDYRCSTPFRFICEKPLQ